MICRRELLSSNSELRILTKYSSFSRRRCSTLMSRAAAILSNRPVEVVSQADDGYKARNSGPAVAVTAKVLPKAITGRVVQSWELGCLVPFQGGVSGSAAALGCNSKIPSSTDVSVLAFWSNVPQRSAARAKPRNTCPADSSEKTGRKISSAF